MTNFRLTSNQGSEGILSNSDPTNLMAMKREQETFTSSRVARVKKEQTMQSRNYHGTLYVLIGILNSSSSTLTQLNVVSKRPKNN